MELFTSNTTIRFRLGHNQSISTLLEDSNLSCILDNHKAEAIRDKIKIIDTVIVVWIVESIPIQAILEVIE